MKLTKTTFVLMVLLCVCNILAAQEKYSTVKIYTPADRTQRAELIALLQVDHFQTIKGGGIIVEISASDLEKLRATRYRYEILVDDVARDLEQKNRQYYIDRANGVSEDQNNRLAFEQTGRTVNAIIPTPTAFTVQPTFGGYNSFHQMDSLMNLLVATYPALAKKSSLGTSHNGNSIWCIKISDNVNADDPNEPEVLFVGLQHAREAIGGSSMIFLMQYLCQNYATDSRIKDLVDNREIFIIPCMNPDGWEYNRLNGGVGAGWRKNRRNNGSGNFGVDLNRNWGIDWGNCGSPIQGPPASCGSNSTSQETYYGPSAFSEPETQAIRDFTYTRHFVAMIDQHSYGPYYSLPFGRPSLPANVMNTTDQQFYTWISSAMGNYNGMRAGNSYEALGYEVAGGVKDWMMRGNIGTGTKGKVMGMTGEGGAGNGTGGSYGSFWPPASQIINLSKGIVFQDLQLLYSAGSYVDLQDMSDINLASKTGTFDFRLTRVGLENQTVNISVIPLGNIQSVGAAVPVTTLTNYYDTYNGTISYTLPAALASGQRVRFAWKIQTGGITYYDTVTKFYNASLLLYDNMEGTFSTNWTSASTKVNTSGNTVAAENWSYSTVDKFAGTKSMTESASGLYDSLSIRTATYKSTFDLSNATSAYLSFWTKHRAENFRDKLQVQVSPDGTTWTPIAGSTTVQEPGTIDGSTINGQPALTGVKPNWTRELFDLSAFKGNGALRLRFRFTSDDDGNGFEFEKDDGFYIDELKVVMTTGPLVTLPVTFISFSGNLTALNTVDLQWKAVVDEKHSYFVVERSSDGQNFSTLGRVDDLPYRITDFSPVPGINYYRVKQYDIDGNFSYSKTISINYNPRVTVSLYPNPASEDITLRFTAPHSESVTIQVSDLSGKMVYSKQIAIGVNGQEAKINIRSWASQTYIVKVEDSENAILTVQKFVKQ
jgi:carboxypeptidase T